MTFLPCREGNSGNTTTSRHDDWNHSNSTQQHFSVNTSARIPHSDTSNVALNILSSSQQHYSVNTSARFPHTSSDGVQNLSSTSQELYSVNTSGRIPRSNTSNSTTTGPTTSKRPCKCGSTTHSRTSHKDCPMRIVQTGQRRHRRSTTDSSNTLNWKRNPDATKYEIEDSSIVSDFIQKDFNLLE